MSADSSGKNPFLQFIGTWSGEDTIATTQWSRGGLASTHIECKAEIGGRAITHRMRSKRGDGQIVEAFAVFTHGPEPRTVLFHWFDSLGFTPTAAGIGRWNEEGDTLRVERATRTLRTRHVFRFTAAHALTHTLDNSSTDGATWVRVMEGDYRRG